MSRMRGCRGALCPPNEPPVNVVDNVGDIETICQTDPVRMGETVSLVFRADDEATPPFNLRIRAPSGKIIIELLRAASPKPTL